MHQTLLGATGIRNSDADDATDDRVHGRKRWRKQPDRPLGEFLDRKRQRNSKRDPDS